MPPRLIRKRDGKIARYNPDKVKNAMMKAARATHVADPEAVELTNSLYTDVSKIINESFNDAAIPKISDMESIIINTAREKGYNSFANAYEGYRNQRAEARKILSIITNAGNLSTTDAALLIESDSKEVIGPWDRERIIKQLELEADLSKELATDVAKKAENLVIEMYLRGVRKINTTDVRGIVDVFLRQEGLEIQRKKQSLLGIPSSDLESIIYSKSAENSNVVVNNPEAVNLEIAERIQKRYALENIFSQEVAEAHLKGVIHLHDLGYPTRVYCSSHSLEYIKKYGLNKVLANLKSKSNAPNSAEVLNQHIQTFLASLQAHYAGALGFGFLNIFYSSLLNRPIDVVKGKIEGREWSFEKRDLEKLIEQGEITLDKNEIGKKYFEKISERKELKELPSKVFEQVAQNLVYAASQNAFSRGGQTLFIDFNIHAGVPSYLKNVPAIGPGGKYMVMLTDGEVKFISDAPRFYSENPDDPRNGDADDSKLEGALKGGKILTYGFFEPTSQKFAKSLLSIWEKGDKDGRPFHFPKCDFHVEREAFEKKEQEAIIDYAAEVATKNGSVYFMFDRGNGAVLAQCCRLKEKIEDKSMLKYPEKLRFCGFQNVTVNLAQATYKGKTLEGTLNEIDNAMELALKAHQQKAAFMQKLLDTDESPQRSLGRASDDGSPYIDLKKSTYIIGNIGLNEAVQSLTGRQLHESEEAYRLGLQIVAHMYRKIDEFKGRTGLKFTIEETPAESTTRRFAKVDRQYFEQARKVVKGTEENPYYTNSIHFAPDADISLVDRIVGQSNFHELIASGSIVHAYMGERRIPKETVKEIVRKTLNDTRCSQLVFSPTYTECDSCGNVMAGEKELCTTSDCKNNSKETIDKDNGLHVVTKIVGYNSRVDKWNGSQQQIYQDRKKAEEQYAGGLGRDMSWMYNPNRHDRLTVIEFAKEGCVSCANVQENVRRKIERLGLDGQVNFKVHYLNKLNEDGLVEAAMYGVPLDTVPTLVISGKKDYWKKTTEYGRACTDDKQCTMDKLRVDGRNLIKPGEIEVEITKRMPEYDLVGK